jgi:hypothetical protein
MRTPALWLLATGLLLAGCAGAAVDSPSEQGSATRTVMPDATPADEAEASGGGSETAETRTDEQGSVVFAVTPLNLASPGDTVDFQVVMDTHSVDLGWDLAALGTLRTDLGTEVEGVGWPVGSGHHYGGRLSFPARSRDGASILDGAATLTLVIRNTDVAERVFVWELAP